MCQEDLDSLNKLVEKRAGSIMLWCDRPPVLKPILVPAALNVKRKLKTCKKNMATNMRYYSFDAVHI